MMRTVTLSFDVESETASEFLMECAKAAHALEDAGFVVKDIHGVDSNDKTGETLEEKKDDHTELINDLDRHAVQNFGDDVSAKTVDKLLDFSARYRYDPSSPEGVLEALKEESEEMT